MGYRFIYEDDSKIGGLPHGRYVEIRGGDWESNIYEIYDLLMGFLVAKGWDIETVKSWLYELSAPEGSYEEEKDE